MPSASNASRLATSSSNGCGIHRAPRSWPSPRRVVPARTSADLPHRRRHTPPSRPCHPSNAAPRRTPPPARPPCARRTRPASACMPRSSDISSPSKPIRPRTISAITVGERLAQRSAIPGAVDDVRGHRHQRIVQPLEREQVGLQRRGVGVDHRQLHMAVRHRPPMPRHMLDHADHPAARASPSIVARPSAATRNGSAPSARSPMMSCAPGWGTSSSGRQSTVTPASRSISASAVGVGAHRLHRRDGRHIVQPVERGAGRKGGPFRRLHPRHAPALLVDQDWPARRDPTALRSSSVSARSCDAVHHVAAEQDVARGRDLGEEAPLGLAQGEDPRGPRISGVTCPQPPTGGTALARNAQPRAEVRSPPPRSRATGRASCRRSRPAPPPSPARADRRSAADIVFHTAPALASLEKAPSWIVPLGPRCRLGHVPRDRDGADRD